MTGQIEDQDRSVMTPTRRQWIFGGVALAVLSACDGNGGNNFGLLAPTTSPAPAPPPPPPPPAPTGFSGAVYAGTNKRGGNSIAAFGRNANGSLTPIAEYPTGGLGGVFDGADDGVDPLISADSVVAVDNRLILAVNAGSATITSLRINADFSLTPIGTVPTGGTGPVSIAHREGLVYVANADADGAFMAPPDQSGSVTGFRLDRTTGVLSAIAGSTRALGSRPSNVEFSPNGLHLLVSSVNAGSARLAGLSVAEIANFGVNSDGSLTAAARGTAASTLPGNAAGRNLPTSIGIEVVERSGRTFVIATEAREFLASGEFGMGSMFQTGSVSTWEIGADGTLTARSQDVMTGPTVTSGPTSACWIVVSPDRTLFWVASASGAAISSFRLNADGTVALIDGRAASGFPAMPAAPMPLANADGFIDLTLSSDGRYLYQLLGLRGTINAYSVGTNGALARIQQATGLLPMTNIQGLVSVDRRTT